MDKSSSNIEKIIASLADLQQTIASLSEAITLVEKNAKKVRHTVDLLVKKESKKAAKPAAFFISLLKGLNLFWLAGAN